MQLPLPSDPTVTTLFLGNIDATVTEQDIAGVIYPFGQYTSIRIVRSSNCAFIDYVDRHNAEYAASNMYNSLIIKGKPISVNWAKVKSQSSQSHLKPAANAVLTAQPVAYPYPYLPPPPGMAHLPVQVYALPNMALPVAHLPFPHPGMVAPSELSHPSRAEAQSKRQRTDK